jgi:hypothetical protein
VGGHDDLLNSIKAIMAARREELGEPPTPEELLAYRDGLLEPRQRQELEAKLAVHPDAAGALADLLAFPAVEPAPGTPELSDADVAAHWQAFRPRLAARPAPAAPPAPDPARSRQLPAPPTPLAPPAAQRWPPAPRLAAAALLALAVGLAAGFLAGRTSSGRLGSAINVKIAELAPNDEGQVRSAASAVEIPEGSEELVLVLRPPARDERGFPAYEAELLDHGGARIWARRGLHPTPLGTFHLAFRRAALAPGRYRVQLFGRDGNHLTLLAAYDLRLVAAPASR